MKQVDGRKTPITIKGKNFKSLKEAANYFKLSSNVFYSRWRKFKNGQLKMAQLIAPVDQTYTRMRQGITLGDGKHFDSLSAASNYYGISQTTFLYRYRLYQKGKITAEELIDGNDLRRREL